MKYKKGDEIRPEKHNKSVSTWGDGKFYALVAIGFKFAEADIVGKVGATKYNFLK